MSNRTNGRRRVLAALSVTLTDLEAGVVRGCITIDHSFDDILYRLKTAWIALRHDHPFLAVSTLDDKVVYKTPDESELEDWTKKTLVICKQQDDPATRLKVNSGAALFPIFEKGRVTLIVKCPHRYIDGRGMVHLLSNLVRLVAQPRAVTFGNEWKNLSPSLRISAGIPNPGPEKVQETMQTVGAYLSNPPSNTMKVLDDIDQPATPLWKIMIFSAADTEKIVKAARNSGVSVTHVVCAGGALAAKVIGGDNGAWANLAPFSLRPHLLAPYSNTDLYPVSCWLLQMPIVVEVSDLLSTAKRVKTGYTLAPNVDPATLAATFDHFYDMIDPEAIDPSTIRTPNISCLGVLDTMFSAVDIPTINFSKLQVGIDMADEGFLGLHAWTWKGRLNISTSYSRIRYSDEMVLDYLQQMATSLGEGLGLQLKPTFE